MLHSPLIWHSTMQDDKSRESSRRSEADSEEAVQDVCALSQEGSLGSFSDSDRSFKLRMAAAAECASAPSLCCKVSLADMGWTVKTHLQHTQDRVVPLALTRLGCTHQSVRSSNERPEDGAILMILLTMQILKDTPRLSGWAARPAQAFQDRLWRCLRHRC